MHQKMFIFSILILGLLQLSFAQDNSWGKPDLAPQNDQINVDFSKVSNTDLSHPLQIKQERVISAEEQQLLAEQRIAKASGNQLRVLELDLMLDRVRGITSSQIGSSNGATITKVERAPFLGGNDVNTTLIWNSGVKGLATQTEQAGANTGRIWAFVLRDTTSTVVDRATLYYSDNGGLTWSAYLFLTLGGTDKFVANTADIEIVESATGAKFMWVVYGYTVGSPGGAQKVGLMGVNITTFAGGVFGMAWPGNDNAKRYYRPRISSDNPNWAQASTWLFIICSFDSTAGPGWDNAQKYAEIHTATNVTAPTITYKGPYFSWYMGLPGDNYRRDLHSDVLGYRNGGLDSVMVTFSNIRDSTRVWLASSSEGSYTYNAATRTGTTSNYHQNYTYLCSPGSTNGQNIIMVNRRNFTNNGDWDVYSYRSTNGCIPGSAWTTAYVDSYVSTVNIPGPSDVISRRGAIDFRTSYTYDNVALDSVKYSQYTTSWSSPRRVSYLDSSPFYAAPKPGFRTGGGDDCFILWAVYNNNQVWSSRLCNSTVGVNNNNNSVPHEYTLSQNYPNPFNPVTTINFGVPRSGFVKITVYDITGKVVATPVNSQIEAGNYNISFDASMFASGLYFYKIEAGDFSDTKKMVLIK